MKQLKTVKDVIKILFKLQKIWEKLEVIFLKYMMIFKIN